MIKSSFKISSQLSRTVASRTVNTALSQRPLAVTTRYFASKPPTPKGEPNKPIGTPLDGHYVTPEKLEAEQARRRRRFGEYSELTKKFVWALGRMMGYNTNASRSIRVTSDMYDMCAIQAEINSEFWIKECGQPDTYQTWFSVTKLHVWMLIVRIRQEDRKIGRMYLQELINHFFVDAELRMREKYGVVSGRTVTTYLKDLWEQFNGGLLALDEGIASDDTIMASALYRNVFDLKLHPVALAKVTEYVRRQIRHFDSLPSEDVMHGKGIKFVQPKVGNTLP